MAERLKKDDLVVVIAGRDKGARGRILRVYREAERVIVEGVNMVKRHQKPNQANPQGGIVEKELPIHMSNLMLVDTKDDKRTRIRMGEDKDGKKVRVTTRTATVLG